MTMRSWLVMGLIVSVTGCAPGASSQSDETTGNLGGSAAPKTYTPFQEMLVQDFTPTLEHTGIHGIYSWQASVVGDGEGQVALLVVGGDLDGLTQYAVQLVLYDPKNPQKQHDVVIGASSLDGSDVGGLLDDSVRAAIAADFGDMFAQLQAAPAGAPLSGQSLRTQSLGLDGKDCWKAYGGAALGAIATLGLVNVGVIACPAVALASLGLLGVACVGTVGTLAVGAGLFTVGALEEAVTCTYAAMRGF